MIAADRTAVAAALAALAADRPAAAVAALTGIDTPLATALRDHLERDDGSGSVYDAPAAFDAFISGGGNLALYAAVDAVLADLHTRSAPVSVLEIGCGDGRVVVKALDDRTTVRVDLVEPSPMLRSAVTAVGATGVDVVRGWSMTAQEFVSDLSGRAPADGWALAEATFALHALAPAERSEVLAALRPYVRELAVVEFDVPALVPGGDEQAAFLTHAYERGIVEYDVDRELVAHGFLLPVLVGQLRPGAVRATWEQPADRWARQVAAAGFRDVQVRPVADYWWSPAFLLTARG